MEEPIQEILKHNKDITRQIREKRAEIRILAGQIKAPCMSCRYDGVYRCEACSENYYEGYNIKDYPN